MEPTTPSTQRKPIIKKTEAKPEPRSTVIASGEVRPIRYINLTSELPGRIREIYVNPGDWVTKGQALVLIDSSQGATATQVSPLDGFVADIPARAGEIVFAGMSGTPLMTIADMFTIYVDVNVDQTEIADVQVGQQATIIVDAFGEKEIRGLVTYKNPLAVDTSNEGGLSSRVNAQQEEFKVTVELRSIPTELRNRLRPGMSATATITIKTKKRRANHHR